MLSFARTLYLIGMLALPRVSGSPISPRAPGDKAELDVRIWALPDTHAVVGVSTTVNGQDRFVETSYNTFGFQAAQRPPGSEQDYNMVGIMTFYVVPETPRAMYITSDTLSQGANCTVTFTEGRDDPRTAADWFVQHSVQKRPDDMVISCNPGSEAVGA